jgi:uncharacterized protein (DUF2235 family)
MSESVAGGSPRRLVILCDGTWDSADRGGAASNVVRLARTIKPVAEDGTSQIVYYHPGVGTGNGLDRLIGGGTGVGLARNVRDAYAFLVNNFQAQDEIFLFGFSRGAYTARSLAGLIGTIGLLPKQSMGDFLDAWAYYKLTREQRRPYETTFEQRFRGRRSDVPVKCLGVWDTVGSLGIPTDGLFGWLHPCRSVYQFLDVELGAHVEHAFQALAIDEKRSAFRPAVWQPARQPVRGAPVQTVRQVWFAGVHSDCGGGYPVHGAADLAFLWIASQVAPLLALDDDCVQGELDRTQVQDAATLHETLTWIWWAIGRVNHRAVGGGLNESVHSSVVARLDAGHYTPAQGGLRAMPVEPLSAYERRFAWQGEIPWQPSRPLVVPRRSLCEGIVRFLGGG